MKNMEKTKCDICEKAVKVTPTVKYKIDKDGLLIYCKDCWSRKGLTRDRYKGQIQSGAYLSTNLLQTLNLVRQNSVKGYKHKRV